MPLRGVQGLSGGDSPWCNMILMSAFKHFFVYQSDRPDDPFYGIKALLQAGVNAEHLVHDIRLSDRNYACVNRVDYSFFNRKVRFLYYKPVFAELERLLDAALQSCAANQTCVFYFSDEGVWAEFWRGFRETRQKPLIAVNIQHGWADCRRVSTIPIRRAANLLARTLFGVPAYGMGNLGGVGAGVFDIYLVYTEENARFVSEYTGDSAFVCPSVIKTQLLQSFQRAQSLLVASGKDWPKGALFALQPPMFPGLKQGTTILQILQEWLPIVRILSTQYHLPVVIRRHPGISPDVFEDAFQQSGIAQYAEADPNKQIAATLASVSLVFCYASTVLFEAYLLGLVPTSIKGGYFRGEWKYHHELLDLNHDLQEQIRELLQPTMESKYARSSAQDSFDWENILLRQTAVGGDSVSSCTPTSPTDFSCHEHA